MSNKNVRKRRVIWLTIFITYITLLIYFLFFSDTFGRQVAYDEYRYNLMPFAEIKRFYTKVRDTNYLMFFINIIGNVVLFVPFGFLFSLIYSKGGLKHQKKILWVTLLVSILLCLLIELLQLVTKVGVFDVDDIIMNTTGTLIGYIVFRVSLSFARRRKIKAIRREGYAKTKKTE